MSETQTVKDGTEERTAAHDDLRKQINAALQESIDHCARCKACDVQVDAVMGVVVSVLAQVVAQAVPDPVSPSGEYAEVQIMGHNGKIGWVTDGSLAGGPCLDVRDGAGLIAKIPPHSVYLYLPLLPPGALRQRLALASPAATQPGDEWPAAYPTDDEEPF